MSSTKKEATVPNNSEFDGAEGQDDFDERGKR